MYLTPFIPPLLQRRGGVILKRGEASLKLFTISQGGPQPSKEWEEILERGGAPSLSVLPPSLIKGRGSGG